MIYSGVIQETKINAQFFEDKWHITYTISNSRTNTDGIEEKRELIFTKNSGSGFDNSYRDIMSDAYRELVGYEFDLFKIPGKAFLLLKERLKDGETKDNQITKN